MIRLCITSKVIFVHTRWNQEKMEKGHAHINGCLHKSMFKVCNWFNSQSKRQHWAKWFRYLSISCHSLEYRPILLFHIYEFKVIYMVLQYYLCTYETTLFPLPKKGLLIAFFYIVVCQLWFQVMFKCYLSIFNHKFFFQFLSKVLGRIWW